MSTQPPPPVRVLIADDHPMFAQALVVSLLGDPRLDVVGLAPDGAVAVELARELAPDVILMDVNMPRLDGIEATRTIVRERADIRIVVLSSSSAVEDVERSRDAGASAYLTKDADATTIVQEVLRVAAAPVPLTFARAA